MAATQAQRAALYTTLADTIGDDAADTLMTELPPGGWDRMATKDDLAGVEARLTAAVTAGLAGLEVKLTEGLAQAATERAKLNDRLTEGLAQAATERAKLTEGLAQAATERAKITDKLSEGLGRAAIERAEIVRSQARQLYVIVATTVAATISIWLALFAIAVD